MNKEKELTKLADEIAKCRLCRQWGEGKAVPGEGDPDAEIMFIGEAPGKEEAKAGRPFIGRSGKFLREMMQEIGLDDRDVFITSPVHYLPVRGTPSKENILHGREHLFRQLAVIDPKTVVLLGNTACLAVLDRKAQITKEHGHVIERDGRKYLITFHPASAMRFPAAKKAFIADFKKLERMLGKSRK